MSTTHMTPAEIEMITGYRLPALQLRRLHELGYHRATISRLNVVVLEREHVNAVARSCMPASVDQRASAGTAATPLATGPRVLPITRATRRAGARSPA